MSTPPTPEETTFSCGYVQEEGYESYEVMEVCAPGYCDCFNARPELMLDEPHANEEACDEEGGYWVEPGFYYWFCMPGYLPSSDGLNDGPFESYELAMVAVYEDIAENAAQMDDEKTMAVCDEIIEDYKRQHKEEHENKQAEAG